MRIRHFILTTAIAALILSPAHGQTSLADQKLQADIDKVRLDIEAARLKEDLDRQTALTTALAAVRGTTGGSASVDKPEATAEGLLLTRKLYAGAAAQLAAAAHAFPEKSSPLVIFGTAPPSTADWIAFQDVVDRLEPSLRFAASDWKKAVHPSSGPPLGRGPKSFMIPIGGIAVALNAITSVASLFRVDTTMAGSPLAATDSQLGSLLSQALIAQGFRVDGINFEIAGEPSRVKEQMSRLLPLYREASRLYHDEYIQRLAAVKKPDELNPAVALAGKHLEVAVGDFETLQRTLYTSVAGVLPATLVERQAIVAENRGRPLIYVSNYKAALTSMTRKGFLTTLGRNVPIFLNASAELDYILMAGPVMTPGTIICVTPRTRITDIPAVQTSCAPLTLPGPAVAALQTGGVRARVH
ncbi:MAG: hypothetical protein QOH81_3013 [Sphingomonadales bacterium]|jgi:hypothetical protein|nr:hypothetical protein [Sphingomonadales bacterium]